MTSDTSHQLTTRLDALIDDAAETAVLGMGDVEREASMLRRSNSPYSAREKNAVLRRQFHKTTAEMAKTVARASHLDDAAKLTSLEAGALQLSERLAGLARTDYSEAGGLGDKHFFARVYEELRAKLDRDVASLKHDFPTGFVWGEPAETRPSSNQINIGAIHGGSPQIAAGGVVNQTMAINQAIRSLVTEITAVRQSKEFAALDETTRRRLEEAAFELEEEADAPAPDATRMKRWGERLLHRLKEAGLILAEEAVKGAFFAAMGALAGPGITQ